MYSILIMPFCMDTTTTLCTNTHYLIIRMVPTKYEVYLIIAQKQQKRYSTK